MSDPFGLAELADPLPIAPAAGPVASTVRPPGSKSITNRALICAALAAGRSEIVGLLDSDDTQAMLSGIAQVGIDCEVSTGSEGVDITVIKGVDQVLTPQRGTIDTRQSGTTSRFLLPLLAIGSDPYEVTAHPQMQERPMGETFAALRTLGATIDDAARPGHLPVRIQGPTVGGSISVAGDVSSQFLSGLLLAGPCMPEGLTVTVTTELVSRPYVDLTISVMEAFGAQVARPDPQTFGVHPTGYRAVRYDIEPDASAASYAFAAAALCGGSITVTGLGNEALQGDAAFADVLAAMGATIARTAVGTTVTAPADGVLRGGTFDFTHISDTAQTMAVLAPFAESPVTITGIGFIRRKEIDRITAVTTELRRAGVRVDEGDDGWTIHPGPVAPTTFETYEDHRMAMSFALIGLRVPGIGIAGPACVAKTFPGYWAMLDEIRASSTDR